MKFSRIGSTYIVPFPQKRDLKNVVPEFAISLSEAEERINTLQTFVDNLMVKDIDYGLIPGYSKPTLLKPGAEKLCDAFGFSKHVDIVNRVEEWEKGIFSYEVKVTLISKQSGHVEAEGIGACNSLERSYQGQDAFSLINTLLKMAKKRALIDAVLSATRASGIFTQDIEHLPKPPESTHKGGDEPASPKQLQMIYRTVEELCIQPSVAKELMRIMYEVDHSTKLTKKQASSFIQDLLLLKSKPERS